MLPFIAQRLPGYSLLSGKGIEIGAFEHPAQLPSRCKVEYCDAITPEQAQKLFPEIDTSKFVKIDHIIDLNREGLSKFPDGCFDFVIFNHVIEHLANPIYIVSEVLRTLKYGGCMVIAAPDKHFTFDKNRPLTSWEHLVNDFEKKVTDSEPEDYRDILTYIHPKLLGDPAEQIQHHLRRMKDRREHLHIWDSATFRDFLDRTVKLLNVDAIPLFERIGAHNQFEYFGVWAKGGEEVRARFQPKVPVRSTFSIIAEKVNARYKQGGFSGVFSAVKNKLARSL